MISQNLFQSIDTIISKRLHEVSFDITLICEVIEDAHKAQGQYTVKTDTMRFVAQGEENKYSVGQSVYVTVPQGNYSLQKVIIGTYNKDTVAPTKYLRPLDYLLPTAQSKLELGDDGKYTWSQACDFAYFGVSFDVNYTGGIIEDGYGFEVFVDGQSVGKFDSSEFFGDPYNMFGFNQQKVFAAEAAWNNITLVPYGVDASCFSNVQIIAGPPQEEVTEAKLEIMRIDTNGGEVASDGKPELQAVFVAQDPITGRYTTAYPNVSWYRWQSATHDFGAGIEWGKILEAPSNTIDFPASFSLKIAEFQGKTPTDEPISFTLNKLFDGVKEERFKAVYIDDNNEKHISNVIILTKPEENSKVDENGNVIDDTSRALVLTIEGAEAKAYNIFGLDNSLIENVGRQTVVATFTNGDTKPSENAEIIWEVKNADGGSMIQNLESGGSNLTATFIINSWYFPSYINNTITCTIKQNGITYTGSITPTFGYQGANGTSYRFNAERVGESDIKVTLQDGSGQYYDWTNMTDKLKISYYSWWTIGASGPIETTPTTPTQINKTISDDKKSVTITNVKPDEGFGIVEIKLTDWANPNGTLVDLNAHVIFPSSDDYTVQGATRIVYDYDGMNASYDQRPYKINEESIVTVSENLVLSIEEKIQDGLTEYYPSIAYPAPTTLNDVYVKFTIDSKVLYQPVLVLVNGYSSDVLNGWNGKLLVDTEGNRILSASMIAGTKDTDTNLFTGVVMGDLGNAGLKTDSGLFGFNAGVERFKLTKDGEFSLTGNNGKYIRVDKDGNFIMNAGELDVTATSINIQTSGFSLIGNSTGANMTITDTAGRTIFSVVGGRGYGQLAGWNFDNNSIVNGPGSGDPKYQNGTFMATGLVDTEIPVYNPTENKIDYIGGGVFGAGKLIKCPISGFEEKDVIKPFLVTKDGTVYCSKANIAGAINATSGKVGGWQISEEGVLRVETNTDNIPVTAILNPSGFPYLTFIETLVGGSSNYEAKLFIGSNTSTTPHISIRRELPADILGASGSIFTYLGCSSRSDQDTTGGRLQSYFQFKNNEKPSTSKEIEFSLMEIYGSNIINGELKSGLQILAKFHGENIDVYTNTIGDWQFEKSPTMLSASAATSSDSRAKNNIAPLTEPYSILFDNLNPVIYKYNNGTSDRYHTGFIAQDVKSALGIAGIDSKDFAGLCIPANENDTWTLRYEEFIALNTSEIQKLKKRVARLEDEVTYLKNIISVTM